MAGFWVVTVDRATGVANSELIPVKDDAWKAALDQSIGRPDLYTTVVRQREA